MDGNNYKLVYKLVYTENVGNALQFKYHKNECRHQVISRIYSHLPYKAIVYSAKQSRT